MATLVGRAVQIVNINEEDHTFVLDEAALDQILSDEKIKDKPVCVVSVAGAFRRGKSFLLDFFLRYLTREGEHGWMGEGTEEDSPLQGFRWKGGSKRDTTGILMWSQVFEAKTESGRDIAIALMDTQGAFDSESTVKDCATVFALSAMISSVLVYNLTSNIQEDDLQHLQLFTEYGRLAMEGGGDKPFQRLQFLVRDWSYPYEAGYGAEGGLKILRERLQVSGRQHPELQSLRRHISGCFDSVGGFLLPHPGQKVATDPEFDGKLRDIGPQFKKHLNDLVPLVLSGENVRARRIGGEEVRCKELARYVRAYVDIFNGDEMPEPKSMLDATSEANNLAALSEAKDKYVALMDDATPVDEKMLEADHERCKEACVEVFGSRKKMGGEELSRKYRERLVAEVEEAYGKYKKKLEKELFEADALEMSHTFLDVVSARKESIRQLRATAGHIDREWSAHDEAVRVYEANIVGYWFATVFTLGGTWRLVVRPESPEQRIESCDEVRTADDALDGDRVMVRKLESETDAMRRRWGEEKLTQSLRKAISTVAKQEEAELPDAVASLRFEAIELGQTVTDLVKEEGRNAARILREKADDLENASEWRLLLL